MTILLETVTLPKSGAFQIDFSVAGEIVVSADDARRSVGVYVGTMLADLLHAEAPILVLKDHDTPVGAVRQWGRWGCCAPIFMPLTGMLQLCA